MIGHLTTHSVQHAGRQVVGTVRAGEWWGYKLSPLLATAYATASLTGVALWPLLPRLLLLLLSLTVGAVYVSVVNDWTDRNDDLIAGKTNRLVGKSGTFVGLVLLTGVGAGLGFGVYFWFISPASSFLYLGAWLAYSLYSLPPVRLKTRGLAGVLADAAGAHVFPQLLMVSLVSHWAGKAVPAGWWIGVGVWASACGIRNIFWHQLSDAAADYQAGVDTFVRRRGERLTRWLGRWVAFPLEVVAFVTLLGLLGQVMPLIFLLLYGGLEACRWRIWRAVPYILEPNQRIVLNEYYALFYPLSLLLLQTIRYPSDGLVLVLHGLLFGQHGRPVWRDGTLVVSIVVRKLLGR